MKMTEFELGKNYTRKCWLPEIAFIKLCGGQYGGIYDHRSLEYKLNYDDLMADDWQEYKEPVDYGDKDNHKLFLIDIGWNCFYEGYQSPSEQDGVLFFSASGLYPISKDSVLKVIDLPSKEL